VSNDGVTLKYGLEFTKGHWKCTIWKLGYGFLFAFYSNYDLSCIISEIKQDIGRKSSFSHTPAFDFPGGVKAFPLEYCQNVWHGKNRMVWLADGE